MALSAKVVSFLLSNDVVGTNQSITGVGFTPQAIIFWWGGSLSATDQVAQDNVRFGQGFAVSPTDRGYTSSWINDNEATMDTACAHGADGCIGVADGTGFTGRWDLVSMDGDGFTLVVDVDAATAASVRVHALCLGGADLTNMKGGTFTKPASIGNQSVVGVGFQPDIVFFFGTGMTTMPNTTINARNCFGAARSVAEQVVVWNFSEDGVGTSNTERYARHDECLMVSANAAFQRATFVSQDVGGFTVNWLEGTEQPILLYLALKGGSWKIGNSSTANSLTTVPVSGFGFAPKGVMVVSHLAASVSAAGVPTNNLNLSFGAADSPTSRGCHANNENDALGTSVAFLGISYDEIYVNLSGGAGMVGEMDVQSFDADGVTFVMDDADPNARVFGYVGLGDTAVAAGGPPGPNALMMMGIGL